MYHYLDLQKIFQLEMMFFKDYVNICSCNPNAVINIGSRTTIGNFSFIYTSEENYNR